ncbi:hypothetical protein PP301_gp069 [Gordonia phage GMA2]|uniref:Polymerase nucleotidyl transferase domain-containing protein n=1 Tax=Gordonia phage GMA2 TaxID=1647283 RepID=A0A0K0N7C1_9CAUD|nr:hypothetical protein PP301_gp069 [Gordonia phage GMA2]AKJ72653.1 hypothetical protein GMA2_115 [Gordonia phage GMA2]
MRLLNLDRPTPDYWTPLLSVSEMQDFARRAANRVEEVSNLTPVAATVTGSRLRGLDREDSDVDTLVLVAEKRAKARTVASHTDSVTGLPTEGQVQSLDQFLLKLDTSVPYTEALRSPALVVDPAYAPLLRGAVPGFWTVAAHAQRFAFHAVTRAMCPTPKAARLSHAAYAVSLGLPTQLDRAAVAPGSAQSLVVAGWMEEYSLHRREVDLERGVDRAKDLVKVFDVCKHLRGLD